MGMNKKEKLEKIMMDYIRIFNLKEYRNAYSVDF